MLDWLIIGGGIQGTALALYLTQRKQIAPDSLRILDPYPEPLALWKRFTQNTGMQYLRSPITHHLHYDPWSLRTFAQTRRGQPYARFIPIYQRPALALFNQYSDWLIEHYHLTQLRLQARATRLYFKTRYWQVETSAGVVQARNVVLAIGNSEHPHRPAWSHNQPDIHHLFDMTFTPDAHPTQQQTVVIGGGISAAQIALTLSKQQPGMVTLLSRHPLREHHFDSDPCWVTRLCLKDFHAEPDINRRRQMIQRARKPGSIPPDVLSQLRDAAAQQRIHLLHGEVTGVQASGLQLVDGQYIKASRVILATGFTRKRPGGLFIDHVINDYGLATADCGYPIVDSTLRWHPGLFTMGPLAELEIGPTARNIIGARLAAERIGQSI